MPGSGSWYPFPEAGRAPARFIVQENAYHIHSGDELREMFIGKTKAKAYDEWMSAFCERKYNSDFSREMARSVNRCLSDFEYGKEAMDAFTAILPRRSTRRRGICAARGRNGAPGRQKVLPR